LGGVLNRNSRSFRGSWSPIRSDLIGDVDEPIRVRKGGEVAYVIQLFKFSAKIVVENQPECVHGGYLFVQTPQALSRQKVCIEYCQLLSEMGVVWIFPAERGTWTMI